jgi:hypothetical protein
MVLCLLWLRNQVGRLTVQLLTAVGDAHCASWVSAHHVRGLVSMQGLAAYYCSMLCRLLVWCCLAGIMAVHVLRQVPRGRRCDFVRYLSYDRFMLYLLLRLLVYCG